MTTTSILVGLGGGGFKVSNSLRFRAAASAYLNRTFSTPTSSTIYTWSGWVKRGALGATNYLFGASTTTNFGFNSSNNIVLTLAGTAAVTTTAVYRDTSAWYHVVYQQNGAAQTIYINGVSVGTGTTANTVFNTAIAHQIGAANTTNYFDGYMAEVNFIDGQALSASSFGTYDTNGVWQPIKYSGTYGANGFYLTFGNTTSTTTLGYDTSGNSNTWTVNNISLTAGTTYDSMTDSPTVSSSTVANYCVLNPLDYYSAYLNAPTQGNLYQVNTTGSAWAINRSTIGVTSGKWYVEVTQTGSNLFAGVVSGSTSLTFPSYTGSSGLYAFFNNGSGTTGYPYTNGASGSSFTIASGDVIGLAYDYSGQTLAIYRNNSLQATVTGIPNTTPMFFAACFAQTTASTAWNFGQRPFSYTPPTGFNALNTYNLPTPTIANGASYMAATTYTGTGATQTINDGTNNSINATFQPDFVWIKSRSSTTSNLLYDVIRGTTNYIQTNATTANTANANTLTAFGSTGFTLGSDASAIGVNVSAATYVAWQWKGGGTGVSNTAGSITSTVSANTAAGFSVVGFTSTQSNSTIGHGLGVAPSMIIFKDYASGTTNWPVYHVSLGATQYLFLNSTSAAATDSTMFNNTAPTSTVFSTGTNSNFAPGTTIAYCFAAVPGYSSFGSFVGNGSADGPFIYTGFLPRWIMIHVATGVASNWSINDSSQVTYNVNNQTLLAENSGAVSTAYPIDFLSNGFKLRTTNQNNSGSTIIYAAFAENPFSSARAR